MTNPAAAAPYEVPISEARARLSELVDEVAGGAVVHLTRRGRRVAALVPEDAHAAVDEAFLTSGARLRERYRDMFDRLADL